MLQDPRPAPTRLSGQGGQMQATSNLEARAAQAASLSAKHSCQLKARAPTNPQSIPKAVPPAAKPDQGGDYVLAC